MVQRRGRPGDDPATLITMSHQLAANAAARTPVVLAIDDQRAPSPPRCAPTATLRRTDVAPCAHGWSDAHRRRPLYDASVHRPQRSAYGPTRATTRAPTGRAHPTPRSSATRATQPRPWRLLHRRPRRSCSPTGRKRPSGRARARRAGVRADRPAAVRAAEPPARATPLLPAPLSLPPRELEPARAGRERATELPAWT